MGMKALDPINSVHGPASRSDVIAVDDGVAAGDFMEPVSAASVVKSGADVEYI